MPKLSASVVLCTYQGERFLPEQLASLRAQTRPPLEILAQDDASSDATFALLEAESKHGILVARRNATRLGFSANFASALAQARGDVIFFCDQDDVWESDKIETMLAHFERNPALLLACSEATKIDETGAPLPGHVLAGNHLGPEERTAWSRPGGAFPQLVAKNPVPGMTMAIRSSLREKVLPVPPGWEHDYWILLVVAGLGGAIVVESRPLVRYRQHQGQVIGGDKTVQQRWSLAGRQTLANRRAEADRWVPVLERLERNGAPAESLALAQGKRVQLQRRSEFPRNRLLRAVVIFGELVRGGYHRYDAGLSSAVKDLLTQA